MQENGLHKFRTIVCEILSFVGNPVWKVYVGRLKVIKAEFNQFINFNLFNRFIIILIYRIQGVYISQYYHYNNCCWFSHLHSFNGAVSIISNNPPAMTAMSDLQRYPDQVWIRYQCFVALNCLFWFAVSKWKWFAHSLFKRGNWETDRNKQFSKQENNIILHVFHQKKGSRVSL